MNHPSQERRRFLATGLSFFGAALSLSAFAGCGDDKGEMTPIENAPDPAKLAKDSMDSYKQDHLGKGGKPKAK